MDTTLRALPYVFGSMLSLGGLQGILARESRGNSYGLPAEQSSNWIPALGVRDLCVGLSLIYFGYNGETRQAGVIGLLTLPVPLFDGWIAYTQGVKRACITHGGGAAGFGIACGNLLRF